MNIVKCLPVGGLPAVTLVVPVSLAIAGLVGVVVAMAAVPVVVVVVTLSFPLLLGGCSPASVDP